MCVCDYKILHIKLYTSHYYSRYTGLTTSRAEMDPWQSMAWDVRIYYVMKFTAEMSVTFLTKAHDLTINRSSMFMLISSCQKPFNIHITIQVKVILAIMEELEQLQRKPRKHSWGSNALDLLPTRLQLVEHRTGIVEVMGSNPVGASNFFWAFFAAALLASYCNCENYLHEVSFWWGRLHRGVQRWVSL